MQGCLRNEALSVTIESVCAQSDQPLRFTVDSSGDWEAHQRQTEILLFQPDIDWATFTKPNIIDDY